MRKRLFAIVLALVMVISLLPMTAMAEGEETAPTSTESTSFTPTETVTPAPTETVSPAPTPNSNAVGGDVKTGGDSGVVVWSALALISTTALLAGLVVLRKKATEK